MKSRLIALMVLALFVAGGAARAGHEPESECGHHQGHHYVHRVGPMWCCAAVAPGGGPTGSFQGCVWIPPWEASSCQAVLASCGDEGFVCQPSKVEPPVGIAHVGHPVRDCTCFH